MNYILLLILVIAIFGVLLIIKFSKNNKLQLSEKKRIYKILITIKKYNSSKEKIIDFDKLYHKILLGLGYFGTFGKILKSNPKIISDINKIWELHKLRNQLVHNFDNIPEEILNKKALEYEKMINILLKKI